MHPQSTPQNTADTPTMLSENTRLAEMRFWQVPSINRLQTPTKLVLNRAFQIATNKILSGWKLRCCLTAACASGTQGLAPPAPCVEENTSGYDDLRSLQVQVQKVTAQAQRT